MSARPHFDDLRHPSVPPTRLSARSLISYLCHILDRAETPSEIPRPCLALENGFARRLNRPGQVHGPTKSRPYRKPTRGRRSTTRRKHRRRSGRSWPNEDDETATNAEESQAEWLKDEPSSFEICHVPRLLLARLNAGVSSGLVRSADSAHEASYSHTCHKQTLSASERACLNALVALEGETTPRPPRS
jgi:hypothetical protein